MKVEEKKQNIIFSINSDSIGVFMYEKKFSVKDKKYVYTNIFTERKYIKNNNESSFEDYFQKITSLFSHMVDRTLFQVKDNIDEIYLVLSSPWISSQKRIVHFEKDMPFIFSKGDLNKLLEKNKKEAFHHTHDFHKHSGLTFVEQSIIDLYGNGYPTKRIQEKKLRDVDVHTLVSVMSQRTQDSFMHIIEKGFHRNANILTHNIALYGSLLKVLPNENDILHIHIDGEITEIMLIIDDHLKKIGTIPIGINHLIRFFSQEINIPFMKAKSLILMYQNRELDDLYKDKIEFAMKKSFLYWFKSFYNFLDEISKEYIIPDTLLLITHENMQNWFSEWILKTDEIQEHMHAKKNISIIDIYNVFSEKMLDVGLQGDILLYFYFNYIENEKEGLYE